jgi:hypothetical protein
VSSTFFERATTRPIPRSTRIAALPPTLAVFLLGSPTLPAAAEPNGAGLAPSPALASGMQDLAVYAPALAALITMLICAGTLLTLTLVRRGRVPDEEID